MSNTFIQLDKGQPMKGFEELDLSNGYACDMETGICGPVNEIEKKKEVEEESKNENNSMV